MPTATSRPTCMPLAQEFCQGRGIEIGAAAYSDFGVEAWNMDLAPQPLPAYRAEQLRHAGRVAPIHITGLAEALPIKDHSQAFVLASHVLEHSPNPIATLLEWNRVLQPGGVLFLIIPHSHRTPDRFRPRTPLSHLIDDYRRGSTAQIHPETDGFLTPPAAHTPHYHVWTTVDFLVLVDWILTEGLAHWYLEEIEDTDSDRQRGFTFVLRKQGGVAPRDSAGKWISRRALRSMLRYHEQLNFLLEKQLVEIKDLVEVVVGFVVGQDIAIQDRDRTIAAQSQRITELERNYEQIELWARNVEANLLTLQRKWFHIPALSHLRGRLTGAK